MTTFPKDTRDIARWRLDLLDHAGLPLGSRAVGVRFSYFGKPAPELTWAAESTLAEHLDVSPQTVARAMTDLRGAGVIRLQQRARGRRSPRYELVDPNHWPDYATGEAPAKPRPRGSDARCEDTTRNGERCRAYPMPGGTLCAAHEGDEEARRGIKSDTSTSGDGPGRGIKFDTSTSGEESRRGIKGASVEVSNLIPESRRLSADNDGSGDAADWVAKFNAWDPFGGEPMPPLPPDDV